MALTQVPSGMLGSDAQYTGFKNRIINGAMMIDQRNAGASVTITAASANQYVLDRWYLRAESAAGSKVSVRQMNGVSSSASNYESGSTPVGFRNSQKITSLSAYTLGSSEHFATVQAVEGFNAADLAWGTASAQPITVSFWVRSSLTGTFGGFVLNNDANRCFVFGYTISAANTWEYKTITIQGDTSGTWLTDNNVGLYLNFSVACGSSLTTAAGSWSSTFNRSVTGQVSLVGTSGATFYITGVQLEKGSTATSFDYRPYGTELQLCQRYAQLLGFTSGSIQASIGRGTSAGGTNVFRMGVNTTTPLRATPSISFANLVCGVVSSGVVGFSSLSTIYFASGFVEFDCALASSNGTAGQISTLQTSAGGQSYMLLSSEL